MRRSVSACAIAVGLLLAGCTGPSDDTAGAASAPSASTSPASPPSPGPARPAVHLFNETYELSDTEVMVQGTRNNLGSENCLAFDERVKILRGKASVTWSRPAVGDFAMELVLVGPDGVITEGHGIESAVLPIPPLDLDGETFTALAWQIAANEPGGATNDLPGTLVLTFEYEGPATLSLSTLFSCAVAH